MSGRSGSSGARYASVDALRGITVAAMLLVFSINYPTEATPRSVVRAAVGAFFLALLTGGAGGWLVTAFGRLAFKGKRRARAA